MRPHLHEKTTRRGRDDGMSGDELFVKVVEIMVKYHALFHTKRRAMIWDGENFQVLNYIPKEVAEMVRRDLDEFENLMERQA